MSSDGEGSRRGVVEMGSKGFRFSGFFWVFGFGVFRVYFRVLGFKGHLGVLGF